MGKNNTNSDGFLLQRQLVIQRSMQYNLFSDTFLSVALDDIKACEHVLRVILGKAGLKVKSVVTQKTFSKIATRSARLDVVAEDEDGQIYNIEVQREDSVHHAKRMRLHRALIDGEILQKGSDFEDLPNLILIYISETDIWGAGKAVYRAKMQMDDDRVPYEDGIEEIYVNAAVDDGTEIAKLMQYFKTARPDDSSQGELSKRVHFLKCEEGGHEIMCKITDMFYQEGVEKGKEICLEQGKEQGEQKKQHDIAKKMILKGDIPLEAIMEYTDLPLDALKKIQKELLATV